MMKKALAVAKYGSKARSEVNMVVVVKRCDESYYRSIWSSEVVRVGGKDTVEGMRQSRIKSVVSRARLLTRWEREEKEKTWTDRTNEGYYWRERESVMWECLVYI